MKELSIKDIKLVTLDLLKKVDLFCNENNIRYYIHAGTLLGAVRHKGFIPWDDDIDITMFREDYNKFIELTHSADCGFDFFCEEKEKDYTYAFGKICDRNTSLIETYHKNKELGVYIDVFPLDIVPNNINKAHKYVRKCNKTGYMLFTSNMTKYRKPAEFGITSFVKPFVYFSAKIMGKNFWMNKLKRLQQKYSDTNSKYIANCLSPNYVKIFEKSWYNETVLLEFEGEEFCAPKEWDKVLTCMYKDYMQLPPKEKQVTHHDFVVYEKV